MKTKRPMNNEEFLNHIMTIGGITGSLKQIFVIEAIALYADDIIEKEFSLITQEDEDIKNGKRSMVNMRAWVRCAKEIKDLLAKRSELTVRIEEPEEIED